MPFAPSPAPLVTPPTRAKRSPATVAWENSGNDNSAWHGIPKNPPPSLSDPSVTAKWVLGSATDIQAGTIFSDLHRRPERAAKAFGEKYMPQSIADDREYFSFIFGRPNAKGRPEFGYGAVYRGPAVYRTPGAPGDKEWVVHKSLDNLPNVPTPPPGPNGGPPAWYPFATVHTHGKGRAGTAISRPSKDDRSTFAQLFHSTRKGDHPMITHYVITDKQAEILSIRPRHTMLEARVYSGRKTLGYWTQMPSDPASPNDPTKVDFREVPRRFLPRAGP